MQADLDFNPACALIQLCDRGELLSLSELRCPSLGDGTVLPGAGPGEVPCPLPRLQFCLPRLCPLLSLPVPSPTPLHLVK